MLYGLNLIGKSSSIAPIEYNVSSDENQYIETFANRDFDFICSTGCQNITSHFQTHFRLLTELSVAFTLVCIVLEPLYM